MGIRFTLPPEWNVTGFSTDPGAGYLKVDSPGTMFAQVKWTDPGLVKPRTALEYALRWWRTRRGKGADETPDLQATLDEFLRTSAKVARKSRESFDCKVKPEVVEAGGERTARNFSWTGGGCGQGKIWHCKGCGRIVIAQIVGQGKDPVANVASGMFGDMVDHPEEGWATWGLYDLVASVPEDFALETQQLMSGYLKLVFRRAGGEKLVVERWGLANVAAKKFNLTDWIAHSCDTRRYGAALVEGDANGHPAVWATGSTGIVDRMRAYRETVGTWKPATAYSACCWDCDESNKRYAVQWWRSPKEGSELEEVVARCECH